MKNILIGISLFFLLLLSFIGLRFGSALTQEGNPIPYLISIAKHEWSNNGYQKVLETADEIRYVSKFDNKTPLGSVKEYMMRAGWEFKEQMGSGLIFEKNNSIVSISTRQYTRHYYIWDVPKEL